MDKSINKTQKVIESWKDKFDESLVKTVSKGGFLYDVGEDYEAIDFDTDSIKSFFSSLLTELIEAQIEELVGEIRGLIKK